MRNEQVEAEAVLVGGVDSRWLAGSRLGRSEFHHCLTPGEEVQPPAHALSIDAAMAEVPFVWLSFSHFLLSCHSRPLLTIACSTFLFIIQYLFNVSDNVILFRYLLSEMYIMRLEFLLLQVHVVLSLCISFRVGLRCVVVSSMK